MPARRRGQEARRAQRRAFRAAERQAARPVWTGPTEDEVWAEHQAWERQRRVVDPIAEERAEREREERRIRIWREVLAARDAVMADFARWEQERAARG